MLAEIPNSPSKRIALATAGTSIVVIFKGASFARVGYHNIVLSEAVLEITDGENETVRVVLSTVW